MRILNLFAGIGGNRTLWRDEHEITAVEIDKDIAAVYKERFPNDKILVEDALNYVRFHHHDYDFIWASPPCPSHSQWNMVKEEPDIPDMRSLYGLITILHYRCQCRWVVENVSPWYGDLFRLPHLKIGRHWFWSNFSIPIKEQRWVDFPNMSNEEWRKYHGIDNDLPGDSSNRRKILRNCVDYRIGKYILDCAMDKVPTLEAFL